MGIHETVQVQTTRAGLVGVGISNSAVVKNDLLPSKSTSDHSLA